MCVCARAFIACVCLHNIRRETRIRSQPYLTSSQSCYIKNREFALEKSAKKLRAKFCNIVAAEYLLYYASMDSVAGQWYKYGDSSRFPSLSTSHSLMHACTHFSSRSTIIISAAFPHTESRGTNSITLARTTRGRVRDEQSQWSMWSRSLTFVFFLIFFCFLCTVGDTALQLTRKLRISSLKVFQS